MPTAVGTVMLLCLLPVGTMITGSIIVTFFQPGPKLTSAMQHFAAGIVLAAVAIELAPQLAIRIHGQNGVFTISMLLGFFFAIGVLMLISRYFDADDDEDEGKDDQVVKKKEPEIFTSNPAISAVSTPTSAINLDIGSNKTTSTAYSSPVASPRSPMGPSSLDVNSVNVAMPGETDGRWNNNQPGYGNNNNNNNNNWNNNNNNNNNNNGRNRDESFPSQVDHIQYGARGTMDSGYGRGTMDAGYGGRGTMDGGGYGRQSTIGEGSDVSASSYSNNSQSPLTRAPNSSMSNMARGNMAGVPPRYGGNQGGYGNNGGYNNNGNNYGRAPYPPPPGPPSMPEPEGDWNGNNNNNGGYGNNNWNNNMYNNQRGENMYNNQNWNTRTRQRGQSQHTWQPRVRYAAQWKNQGRSDMGYVPPPPPRRNQYGGGNNQWGNSVNRNQWNNNNNGQQNWNNTNRTMDQTHARMPSYMLHGSATTGLAKSIARNSFKATSPPTISTGPTSFINTDLAKKPTVAAPVGAFNIPWGLIVAVAVDASTDGILIGIASAVGQGGIIIAIALSIEMSFLGISTSVEMNEMGVPKNIQIPLLMVLPGFILVGGAIGATVMAGVSGPLFVAFLGFGTAALLFLVVEELLISAHEDLAHDTWYVSIVLFVGFMIVLIMDQFSGPNMCIDSINLAFAALNLDENGKQIPGKDRITQMP